MTKQDIKDLKHLLSTKKKIVIVPHKNPDGDAIGSTLGLYHYLLKNNHNVRVISPNDYPAFLKWIPGEANILKHDSQTKECDALINEADLIFTLDFNAFHRAGNMETILTESNAIKIMIDHHQAPDDYATYMFSDVSMSSTCEMIYHFIDMLGKTDKIDSDIATCLYVGIMTDTGSFRFRSTTSKTHEIIAHLIEKGADNTQIHANIYDSNSYDGLQLLGCALSNLKVITINKYIIKISLRSKGDFSVNELSRTHFNGGGHTNAAGGRSEVSLQNTVDKFISILPSYKKALNNE